jgi:hypothetical protein
MNAFKILRVILALTHLTLVIFIFFSCIFAIYLMAGGNINYPLILAPEFPINSKQSLIYLLSIIIVFSLAYLYLVTTVRNLIISLASKVFTRRQASAFKLTGKIIIVITISENIISFMTSLLFSELHFGLFFSDLIFSLGTGCFFIVLGQIFERGKIYKEENELTV